MARDHIERLRYTRHVTHALKQGRGFLLREHDFGVIQVDGNAAFRNDAALVVHAGALEVLAQRLVAVALRLPLGGQLSRRAVIHIRHIDRLRQRRGLTRRALADVEGQVGVAHLHSSGGGTAAGADFVGV